MSENENKLPKVFSLRNLFLVGNFLLLIFFIFNVVKDQRRSWKYFQKDFKALEIEKAQKMLDNAQTDGDRALAERELKTAKSFPIEIRQIWATELNAVDRCITCHAGYDPLQNPSLTNSYKEQPFSATSETPGFDIHKAHDLQKFGCVVCHGGQGYATETQAAHGEVHHWEKPLLKGTLLQASCVKCHDNHAELTFDGKPFTSDVIRAKTLFRDNGCIGCHQIGGEGGPISVDLKEETSNKSLSRIDFNYSGLPHEKRTLANWIKIHFIQDPMIAVPGDPHGEFNSEPIAPSAMPPFYFSDEDADALTAYILGLNRSDIPPQFLTLRPSDQKPDLRSPLAHGRWVFEQNGCAGCHGNDGRGGVRNYNYRYDVTPNLRRAVSTYTRAELKDKINHGVPFVAKFDSDGPNPPLYMPAWKDKIKGRELEDLVTYLFSIRE